MVEYRDIQAAAERLKGIISPTPLIHSTPFSEEYGHDIYIKPENLQITGAFKIRGAYNMIASLDAATKERGLIASSAGNHAQGVALAAKLLNANATIVMPKTTPLIKTEGTRKLGAKVVLAGDIYDEAYTEARRI